MMRHQALKAALTSVLLAGMCVLAMPMPTPLAQGLIPADFFNAPIDPSAPTDVEADQLVFDSVSNTITASGDVVLGLSGYVLSGQNLIYNRNTGDLVFTGAVTVRDPSGNVANTENLRVTGALKRAFLDSLTIVAYDGSMITADSVDYDDAVQTLLVNAQYSPCGECIDAQGRRIGWSMRATKITLNREDGSVAIEQPTLSLLGIPVAWLPYLWLPDLSDSALADVPRPSLDYSDQIGLKVEVPFTAYANRNTSILLTPTLLTRQGFLLGAEWVQRFDHGSFSIKASGLYQFDKAAFTFPAAQRDWRGAIQFSGEFVPATDWIVGAAYSVFTDPAYFADYRLATRRSAINEVYATHLTTDTFIDARLQEYNILGDAALTTQQQQGMALPNLRFEHTWKLAPGAGQVDIEGKLLGIYRELDSTTGNNVYGYSGRKVHGTVQAAWHNQIVAGGLVVTPFVGLRADGAYYDGASPAVGAPPQGSLWSATPIAALDIRYPLISSSPGVVHFVEPIAQIVYRGGSSTAPGITNEDSQSVVFDDTRLFDYNRFSGIDRQETGLRANIGGRYMANFDNGSYVELVAGQSFHLAGTNAFATPNAYRTGVGSGLETPASNAVLGLYGSFIEGLRVGGKLQVNTGTMQVARANIGATYAATGGWAASLKYHYTAPVPAAGNLNPEHEVGGELTIPVAEYWSISSGAYWDLAANSWLQVSGGLVYDDGYLVVGATVTRTGPTHVSPNDTRFTANFRLKAPAGFYAGYSGAVPVGNLLRP
jgi:LPS-assembly protein